MASKLLISTAFATLLAGGAMAQTTTPTVPAEPAPAQPEVEMVVRASGHLASNLIGETVYSGTGTEAENIGKVTDIVISGDGNVEAIVVGVGGFLGIGRKEVALQYDVATWVEREGDRWLVVETNADALKALDDFDRSAYRPMPVDADVAEPKPATAEEIKAAEEKAAAAQAEAEAQPEAQPVEPEEE
ncbi:PRC-barrel domain-containing protein [Nitratireductor luteus]|uniref:PRC-barrel domain-containing protein n=1 Tax=Nitratireductor luteus TaxID=2976980 RepID=UPI0022406E07|nr:PRC-barrel domain-containing protein [Nitratireductor luteus]